MSDLIVGDTVHYSHQFRKATSMYTYDEALGQEAEIISIRGRMARLRWRDDSETSALLSNLAKIQVPGSTYDSAYQERLMEERALLLLDAAIEVKTA